ncbi:DUF3817 domain-containing protein [Haloechinothrix halophila]|uniref:DUF3817 domain-containing protein n=1 Tax=Haloechinothrix halophila TaxID=1069073 RepID=UPI0004215AA6|nr:DUF3817 domain-containing protein [Haloechinothrix halophila]
MTTSEQQDTTGTTREGTLRAPLRRFRVAAVVTGIGLLGLVVVMIIRYGFGNPEPSAIYSPIHGAIYMVYLALAVDLALKARWTLWGTAAVLLAGCIPFVSFLAERKVTHRVRAHPAY